MRCALINNYDDAYKQSIKWLETIEMHRGQQNDNAGLILDIQFINTPAFLKVASHLDSNLQCYKISSFGLTFYFTDYMLGGIENSPLGFESNRVEGEVFVPMSNIESISTIGNIVQRR